jgi:hypothetical protein
MDQPTVTITIELSRDGDAPAGHVRLDSGVVKGFSGWIGLVAVLDEIVNDLPPAADGRDGAATSISRRTQ